MISNKQKWHYLPVKNLPALSRGINYKYCGDFYCQNCFHHFTIENKLELHKKVCENKYFCNVSLPSDDTEILEFNQNQKSDKATFIIY